MRARHHISPELSRLLELQEHVVSRQQALRLGLTRRPLQRLLDEGAWVPVLWGVYLVGERDLTCERRAWAGHLSLGGSSAVGGALSLSLLGVEPDERDPLAQRPWTSTDASIDLWVPEGVKRVCPEPFRVLRDHAGRLSRKSTRLLPTIGAADALIDVGACLTDEEFVDLLARADRLNRCSASEVVQVLRARPSARNRAMMWEVSNDLLGVESTLEWAYREDVERAHGLPEGTRQVQGIRSRIDVRYGRYRTIVELDGRRGHVGSFRDMARDNRHALRGETTLRYGSRDVRGTPCLVAAQVGVALQLRGWEDDVHPCPRCSGAHTSGDTAWMLG